MRLQKPKWHVDKFLGNLAYFAMLEVVHDSLLIHCLWGLGISNNNSSDV